MPALDLTLELTLAAGPAAVGPWLTFALLTVACWGMYGISLHAGIMGMPKGDPNARFKAFFFVGIAYFFTAVLAPLVILLLKQADWVYPARGITWSLIAGTLGAIGAFGVLLAFNAKGSPAVVMSIIFAGAPIVNAVVAIAMHPPEGGVGTIRWQFFAGIVIAACGAAMVMLYRPGPAPAKKADTPPPVVATANASTPSTASNFFNVRSQRP